MSRNRVLQWGCMSRNWWLYDAKYQCPFRSAEKLCMYLEGRHKPLYHPLSDVGDHVVVINTQHIAMVDDMWRKHHFELDTRPKDHIMFKRRPLEDVVKEQEKLNPQKSAKKK
ncbi:RM13-like protein [Mya arenaria]|uniref:RM13-like protein n=1 Tax=Mya arenaria TaxID=6604 RepID=A0ABY7FZV8_MYAAR|nr:RM13-like protein [Mya arenaria]WAR24641.1 RM13-like protein [Mya arenaria]